MNFYLTSVKMIFLLSINILFTEYSYSQVLTFDELKGNYASGTTNINWYTSSWGNGFGHKIYGFDPQLDGVTQLRFASRHNSASWIDALTINSNGRVGIGTTSPISIFEVNGAVSIPSTGTTPNGIFTIGGSPATGGVHSFGISNTPSVYAWIQARSKTTTVNIPLVLNPNGGNVAIGTTAIDANAKLEVKAASSLKIHANETGDIVSSTSFRLHFATGKDFEVWEGPQGGGVLRFLIWAGGNTFLAPNGGNVGVGTLIPTNNLHVKSQLNGSSNTNAGITIESSNAKKWDLTSFTSTGNFAISQGSTGLQRFAISEAGNVGIGTSTPTSLLSLYAPSSPVIHLSGLGAGGLNGAITIAVASSNGAHSSVATPGDAVIASRCGGSEDLILSAANNFNGAIRFTTGPTCNPGGDVERMTILNNGNIGIGTTAPGSFKLAVEGKIGAREVQIHSEGVAWPDYVFADDYQLKPLSEIEKYVKLHRHLPGMPSQEQVKENGGVEVGAMQTRLLEQVEELVLHLIELKKENESIKAQLQELKVKN